MIRNALITRENLYGTDFNLIKMNFVHLKLNIVYLSNIIGLEVIMWITKGL